MLQGQHLIGMLIALERLQQQGEDNDEPDHENGANGAEELAELQVSQAHRPMKEEQVTLVS